MLRYGPCVTVGSCSFTCHPRYLTCKLYMSLVIKKVICWTCWIEVIWCGIVRGRCVWSGADEYYMSSVRQVDTLLTAATQSILLQITWSEAFKVCSHNITSLHWCSPWTADLACHTSRAEAGFFRCRPCLLLNKSLEFSLMSPWMSVLQDHLIQNVKKTCKISCSYQLC